MEEKKVLIAEGSTEFSGQLCDILAERYKATQEKRA